MLLVLGLCLFAWWAQRDAFRTGVEVGCLQERGRQMTRELAREGNHLRLVHAADPGDGSAP